jgi:DNA polymerase-3 subunit epsilon
MIVCNEIIQGQRKKAMEKLLLFIDTETTGLDADRHEVIEVAYLLFDVSTKKILDRWSAKIIPQDLHTANPIALKINGYTEEKWKDAIHPKIACQKLLSAFDKSRVLVGHNISFDMRFLGSMFQRCQIPIQGPFDSIDTKTLAKEHFARGGFENPSLSLDSIRAFFGWSAENAHTAEKDVDDCLTLFLICSRSDMSETEAWQEPKYRINYP